MSLFRNSVVHVCSWAALIGFGFWTYNEPGYEPAIGLIMGFAGIVANFEGFPLSFVRGRKVTPERKIELRDKWRPVFENFFLIAARDNYRTDVIVHDVARLDHYPDIDKKSKGISAWFRVGLMGTYNRGVLLGLRWTYLRQEEHGEWVEYLTHRPEDALKVMLLAEVPYELIESFNPDGDKFYNQPHLFCHFDYGGEPYERLFYGEQSQLFANSPYHYTEVAEFKQPPLLRRLKEKYRLF